MNFYMFYFRSSLSCSSSKENNIAWCNAGYDGKRANMNMYLIITQHSSNWRNNHWMCLFRSSQFTSGKIFFLFNVWRGNQELSNIDGVVYIPILCVLESWRTRRDRFGVAFGVGHLKASLNVVAGKKEKKKFWLRFWLENLQNKILFSHQSRTQTQSVSRK